jgi:hypothetical protein
VVEPDFVESCTEVAVTVTSSDAFPELGAVNKPVVEIEPALADHVTAELKFPVPETDAEHWLVWPYWIVDGAQLIVTDVIVPAGLTVIVVEPDLLVSCDDVAVMVTEVVAGTTGAVNTPEVEMEPALAVHDTPVLKLPVPVTVAEQLLVWLGDRFVGEQLTVTEVMVDPPPLLPPLLPPPLEPQATIHSALAAMSSRPILFTRSSP